MKLNKMVWLIPLVVGCAHATVVRAETPQQQAQRLREYAQFDQARAAEFRKLAGEDEGVARARAAQAGDLERQAENYLGRAQYHNNLATWFRNGRQSELASEQQELANAATQMGTDLRNAANERRQLATQLQNNVNRFNAWAKAADQRAARNLQLATMIANNPWKL